MALLSADQKFKDEILKAVRAIVRTVIAEVIAEKKVKEATPVAKATPAPKAKPADKK